jgi:hypothetical protein
MQVKFRVKSGTSAVFTAKALLGSYELEKTFTVLVAPN